ncbi:acyl-CoA thioesterase [Aridibaculum aurantiacum]|uniref:acyl-CoA thioesterase n=1 Tax=Aridibaculum aurantiacum TaxID=2810307 RepID=UPI001A9737F2|nr:acyl-CoA thioesterase [Aridibaculum aurantiacum]
MPEPYILPLDIRWSDLDPNFHIRHSVYYDFGAFIRMSFFTQFGLDEKVLLANHLGPILFREECIFRREIRFGDDVTINLQLSKASESFSRWSIRHHIVKDKETLAAIINVDGAWIDTQRRKLTVPTDVVAATFGKLVKTEDFEWVK